jgi:acyl-coenzyme A synthetase/AMP-(fatty) acid ligase
MVIAMVDEAVKISSHKPSAVVVFQRQQCKASLQATSAPKDYDWTELVNKVTREGKNKVECEEMKSTDELYLLYTSGTTGKPKGASHPIPIDIRNRTRIRRKCSPTCIHNGIPLQRQTPRNHLLC